MYYISSDLPIREESTDSFRYLSHHGVLGQKWGVRRYQNKDGTRTEAGKKRYSWLQDKLGFDERDQRDRAVTNAAYASSVASAALKAKREAHEKASKPMDYSLETARNMNRWHKELKEGGHTFARGVDLKINETNAWNNYNANPTQENLDLALAASELAETELEKEKELKEHIKTGQQYLSFIEQKKKQEINEYLTAASQYASAATAEQKARAELKTANDAYNKTVLGRIEKGKEKVKRIISRFTRKK